MRRTIPSLNALRAAEAVGRHGSVSGAASELRVTPGAVSRHVTVLEAYFGCALFVRESRGLVLSERGSRYLESIGKAFDLIDTASKRLVGNQDGPCLRVQAYSTFATEWLLPRLEAFRRLHPGIRIELNAQIRVVDFKIDEADVGIFSERHIGHDVFCESLYTPYYLPALSRVLFDRIGGTLHNPTDLNGRLLLHATASHFGWKDWLQETGASDVDLASGHRFESYSQVHWAIRQGAGIGLGQWLLLGPELQSGSLVSPFKLMMPWRNGPYCLVWPRRRRRPEIDAFRDWLLLELREAERQLADALPQIRLVAPCA